MKEPRFLVLLRAVNVAGTNRVPMATLKTMCATAGATDAVVTYLQSGNAVFPAAAECSETQIVTNLENTIEEELGLDVRVLVRQNEEMEDIIANCPFPLDDPARVHVAFLASPPAPAALAKLEALPRKNEAYAVRGRNIYLSYPDGAGRAALSIKAIEKAFGGQIAATGRNWRTVVNVTKLLILE